MKSDKQRNPYVGPQTFSEVQGHLFFGRRARPANCARVLSERLVLFCAQSGAGKSSLINTRLIPTSATLAMPCCLWHGSAGSCRAAWSG